MEEVASQECDTSCQILDDQNIWQEYGGSEVSGGAMIVLVLAGIELIFSWPQLTKMIFHTIWCHAQHIKLGEEEGSGGGHSEWCRLSITLPLCMMEPCFPGDGWTSAWQWKVVNEFLVLLCLRPWLLLYLLNCLYLNPRVFSLLLFWPSPPPHRGRSEWAAVWCLVSEYFRQGLNEKDRAKIKGLRNILTVMKGATEEWYILGSSVEPVQMRAKPEHCVFSWLRHQDIFNRTNIAQPVEKL